LAGAGCCLLGVLQAGLFAHYMHSLILAVFSLLAWVRFGIWAIRLGQKRLREAVNTPKIRSSPLPALGCEWKAMIGRPDPEHISHDACHGCWRRIDSGKCLT